MFVMEYVIISLIYYIIYIQRGDQIDSDNKNGDVIYTYIYNQNIKLLKQLQLKSLY